MGEQKKQLHQSHLQTLYRCGEKFRRVVLNGEREPSGVPLVVGRATHAAVARNLNNKIEKGTLLTKEAVQDYARDEFVREWQGAPIILTPEEVDLGLDKAKGIAQDQTIGMTTEYHYVIAPKVHPKSVERKWVIEAAGYPFDMAGTIDVDEGYGIRDTKTMKINNGGSNVKTSDQYSFYCLAKYLIDGIIPEYVAEDALIKPGKTTPARAMSFYSSRDKDDFRIIFNKFLESMKIISSGLFLPANSSGYDSPCGYCGFAIDGSCKFFNTKRIYSTSKPKQKSINKSTDEVNNLLEKLGRVVDEEGKRVIIVLKI